MPLDDLDDRNRAALAAWEAVRDREVSFTLGKGKFSDFQNRREPLHKIVSDGLLIHDLRRMPPGLTGDDWEKARNYRKNIGAISGAVLIDDTPLGFTPADWSAPNKVPREFPHNYDGRKKNLYDSNVDRVEGPICFDLDDGGLAEAERRCKFRGLAHAAYTTYNHSAEKEKARLVIFPSEPIPTRTLEQGLAYRELYDALGERLCDNRHDTSCRNPARVIFLPAWDGEREKFARFTPGGLYDPRPLLEQVSVEIVKETAARARSRPARAQRAQHERAVYQGGKATYATIWLSGFLQRYAKRFRAADFVKKYPVDRKVIRRPLGAAATYCPFGDEHTGQINNHDALWARNAEGSDFGVFIFECAHKTCKTKRHGGHFLDALISMHKLRLADVLAFVDLTDEEREQFNKPRSTS